MTAWIAYLALSAPALLFFAGFIFSLPTRFSFRTMSKLCSFLSISAVLSSGVAATAVFLNGSIQDGAIGFPLYIDRLSVMMLTLVAYIGTVVIRYSINYLDGDPGQVRFFKWLSWTIGAVMMLVIAGHFMLFVLMWIITSLCLHHLLLFYPERSGAQIAARKNSFSAVWAI
jgi:NAD(P)H-quinone oxidoreductase subunit 5